MRAETAERVLRAIPVGQAQILGADRIDWGPIVDGVEVPDQPRELYRRGQFSRVPLIIGVNGDEGWTFVDRSFPGGLDALQYERTVRGEFGMDADAVLRLYPASAFGTPKEALARAVGDAEFVCETRRITRPMEHDGAPVYMYSFEHRLPDVASGRSTHGLESNFVFENEFAVTPSLGVTSPRPLTPADRILSDAMGTFWRRFMERGDPNLPGVPVQWPLYDAGARHFVFADRMGTSSFLRDAQCNFWESFFFRSVLGTIPAAAR